VQQIVKTPRVFELLRISATLLLLVHGPCPRIGDPIPHTTNYLLWNWQYANTEVVILENWDSSLTILLIGIPKIAIQMPSVSKSYGLAQRLQD
jgi:hypothetical protein